MKFDKDEQKIALIVDNYTKKKARLAWKKAEKHIENIKDYTLIRSEKANGVPSIGLTSLYRTYRLKQ